MRPEVNDRPKIGFSWIFLATSSGNPRHDAFTPSQRVPERSFRPQHACNISSKAVHNIAYNSSRLVNQSKVLYVVYITAHRQSSFRQPVLGNDTATLGNAVALLLPLDLSDPVLVVCRPYSAVSLIPDKDGSSSCRLKHRIYTLVQECRCFHIVLRPDRVGYTSSLSLAQNECTQLTVSVSMNSSGRYVPFAFALSRRSVLHATRITGMLLPHIDLTSSIHWSSALLWH